MSKQQVVAREVAEAEFDRFLAAMDLLESTDPGSIVDEVEKSDLSAIRRRIVDALCDGRLAVDEKGQPVFTPVSATNDKPITFYEPTGASLIAADMKKDGHSMKKRLAVLADLTREPEVRYAKMPMRDLKVCLSLLSLFLA